MGLEGLRQQLDGIDHKIVSLLAERVGIVHEVGTYKAQSGDPIQDPERESRILASKRALAVELGVDPQLVEDIYRRIFQNSYQIEESPK
jgi:chorismate mutase / prephenate dehydrogenase